jgi:non-haem Fe2+, alpha-ketoglutarate-dependent halogenase
MNKSALSTFEENGFIGPLDSSLPKEYFTKLYARLSEIVDNREAHPLYNRYSVRDWHLTDPSMIRLFSDPAVMEPLKDVLGEDLILWRTKIFDKAPGEKELGWHQEWGKFNGEEVGNDIPGLQRSPQSREYWNLTVWFAVCDVEPNMGPIRFARGTNKTQFPIEMAPVMESDFWHDTYLQSRQPSQLVRMAMENSLVLDYDTSSIFNESDVDKLSMAQVNDRIMSALGSKVGAKTIFERDGYEVVELPMKAGQFVIFTERTMHGSGANDSSKRRLGINGRVASSDTLVYPQRLQNEYMDGSNLDIRHHKCILLSGQDKCGKNVF